MVCPDCGSANIGPTESPRRMACRKCRLVWWLPVISNEAQLKAQYDAYMKQTIEKIDGGPPPFNPMYVTPKTPIRPMYDDKGKLIV